MNKAWRYIPGLWIRRDGALVQRAHNVVGRVWTAYGPDGIALTRTTDTGAIEQRLYLNAEEAKAAIDRYFPTQQKVAA